MLRPLIISPKDIVADQPPTYAWSGRIPHGMITLLEGDPQCGKSTLLYDLCCRLSSGSALPPDQRASPPGGVVLLEAEDHVQQIVRTLRAGGASLDRMRVLNARASGAEMLEIPRDIDLIERAVDEVDAKLVILNPLSALLGGNMNNDQSVRKTIAPLAAFAESRDVAVVMVRHLTKSRGRNALCAGAGSMGLIGLARVALRVERDPDSDHPYDWVVSLSKSNLAYAPALRFRTVKRDDDTIGIQWQGVVEPEARGPKPGSVEFEACRVLIALLNDGPITSNEVYSLARSRAGISKSSIRRARERLRIRVQKVGSGKGSHWYWQLPDDSELLRRYRDRELDDLMDQLTGKVGPPPGTDSSESRETLRPDACAPWEDDVDSDADDWQNPV